MDENAKIPCFSLMIREFDVESSSHQTAQSAIKPTNAEISAISLTNAVIVASFRVRSAPERGQDSPQRVELSWILIGRRFCGDDDKRTIR